MAKKNKNIYYIIAVVVVVIVIAVFLMRKPAEEPAAPVAPTEEEPEVVEPVLPEPTVPTEYVGEANMVTNVACVDGKMSGQITNVLEEAVSLGTTWKILVRGLVVKEPGCDVTELAPGESAICTQLNGQFPLVSGKNEVLIRLAGGKEGLATATCE